MCVFEEKKLVNRIFQTIKYESEERIWEEEAEFFSLPSFHKDAFI